MGAEAGGGAGTGTDAGTAGSSALLPALLLTGARLADGRAVDVRLWGERIEAVGAVGSLSAPERLDLRGYLLLPAPAEPHAHLDEAFTGDDRVGARGEGRAGGDEVRRQITEAALTYLGYGATALRTQILVSEETGLARLDAALQAARDLRGLVDCQITVLPGRFTDAVPTAESERRSLALLRDGLRAGAHALGGRLTEAPGPPADRPARLAAHLAALVALARELDRPLDLHGAAGLTSAPASAVGARAAELPPGSILCLDGSMPPASALARSGAGVVVLPAAGRCAGGAPRTTSGFDPASVLPLLEAGVPVAAGSGTLRDTVCPVGRADPLETAFLLSAATGLSAAEAYAAVSSTARAMLGLTPGQIRAGDPAELVAVRGESLTAALSGGHSRVVIHRGRVVSRTSAVREYADTTAAAVPRQGRPGPA
ncbi:hydrolase [Streptacidiphilus sp. MAP5-3]|uniref:hydrolase n=1 Tax=unclassified Streptacidiphilus TaxID=2643834 RepID=UPI0035164FD8